jgi:hypothetical protein
MLTLMLGTVILALTYGAFWHNQPACRRTMREETTLFNENKNKR